MTDNYSSGTVPVGARVEPEVREALQRLAGENYRTISQELRRAIDQYLEREGIVLPSGNVQPEPTEVSYG